MLVELAKLERILRAAISGAKNPDLEAISFLEFSSSSSSSSSTDSSPYSSASSCPVTPHPLPFLGNAGILFNDFLKLLSRSSLDRTPPPSPTFSLPCILPRALLNVVEACVSESDLGFNVGKFNIGNGGGLVIIVGDNLARPASVTVGVLILKLSR